MDKQLDGTQMILDFREQNRMVHPVHPMPWIETAKNAPYFVTDTGEDWTPIGQNDAITWPELKGVFMRKDLATAESYLKMLSAHGVTCIRLMLEYCHGESRYFEKPVGRYHPRMITLWDDLFALCEKFGMRILLTPFDTFWMWARWSHHPYKKSNGGPCSNRNQWLLCADTRIAIKQRLAFATERWGASGALFAWDIWNEIHPAHAGDAVEIFDDFVEDVSSFLRETELRIHGRSHPQTVSLFGPVLDKQPVVADCIFRHKGLNFASTHFYESGTIDNPKNTVDAARSAGRLTRIALSHIRDNRPFFDSEHGPIHTYKDKHITLPEPFDDEYFRHIQWAHVASGGAGGGMRWPNRRPHSLTAGMRKAQLSLARFLPMINWQQFRRKNLNEETLTSSKSVSVFCCGDKEQAVLWLMRTDAMNKNGTVRQDVEPIFTNARIPGLSYGSYQVISWDTRSGKALHVSEIDHLSGSWLTIPEHAVGTDIAFAIKRISD